MICISLSDGKSAFAARSMYCCRRKCVDIAECCAGRVTACLNDTLACAREQGVVRLRCIAFKCTLPLDLLQLADIAPDAMELVLGDDLGRLSHALRQLLAKRMSEAITDDLFEGEIVPEQVLALMSITRGYQMEIFKTRAAVSRLACPRPELRLGKVVLNASSELVMIAGRVVRLTGPAYMTAIRMFVCATSNCRNQSQVLNVRRSEARRFTEDGALCFEDNAGSDGKKFKCRHCLGELAELSWMNGLVRLQFVRLSVEGGHCDAVLSEPLAGAVKIGQRVSMLGYMRMGIGRFLESGCPNVFQSSTYLEALAIHPEPSDAIAEPSRDNLHVILEAIHERTGLASALWRRIFLFFIVCSLQSKVSLCIETCDVHAVRTVLLWLARFLGIDASAHDGPVGITATSKSVANRFVEGGRIAIVEAGQLERSDLLVLADDGRFSAKQVEAASVPGVILITSKDSSNLPFDTRLCIHDDSDLADAGAALLMLQRSKIRSPIKFQRLCTEEPGMEAFREYTALSSTRVNCNLLKLAAMTFASIRRSRAIDEHDVALAVLLHEIFLEQGEFDPPLLAATALPTSDAANLPSPNPSVRSASKSLSSSMMLRLQRVRRDLNL